MHHIHPVCIFYCRAYPDEKGIETEKTAEEIAAGAKIAEPIPMKRELKHEDLRTARIEMHDIAEPIPMKRELKLYAFGGVRCKVVQNCRAYPDEKGIETR